MGFFGGEDDPYRSPLHPSPAIPRSGGQVPLVPFEPRIHEGQDRNIPSAYRNVQALA
jgi:hypothetical protein